MGADTSHRFKVRAWADCLPSYQNISSRSRGVGINIYNVVYADGLDFPGYCCRCGEQQIESMQHIFCECPVSMSKRRELLILIDSKWEEAGLAEEWFRGNWLRSNVGDELDVPEWQQWWGWVGLVPWHAVGRILAMADTPSRRTKARSMVSKTARMMTKYATDEWERRCTTVLEAEKHNGIHDRKVAAGRQKWVLQVEGPQRRRGRPPKDPSDLNVAYQRAKESKVKKRELMEAYGVDAGTKLHAEWVRTRMESEQINSRLAGTQSIKTMLTEHAL